MSALFNAGSSAAGGLFGWIGAKKQRKQQMEMFNKGLAAQQKENDTARAWNEKMAAQANLWARQNVADERFYNTPLQQRSRLRDAGLNPDLIYGGGASGLVDTNVAQTFQSAGTSAPDVLGAAMGVQPTVFGGAQLGIDLMKTAAEVANIRADTAKKQGEMTTINLDNIRKAATNGSMIELDNMQVTIAKQAMELTDKQIANMSQQTNNLKTANDQMNQAIRESMAKVRNMDASTIRNRIETGLLRPQFRNECIKLAQEIKQSNAGINLTNKQAECLVIKTLAEKLNLDADTMYKKVGASKLDIERANAVLQGDVIKVTGQQLELNYKSDQSYKDWERACDMATKVFNSAGNVLNAIIPF